MEIDEPSNVRLTISKRQNWRGVVIAAFLLIIFVVFVLFTIYFICRRCFNSEGSLTNGKSTNYATILNFRKSFSLVYDRMKNFFFFPAKNRSKSPNQVIIRNEKKGKHLDDDYNLL